MKSWKILSLIILLLLVHIEARYTWNGNEWMWNEDSEVSEDIQESSGDYQNDDEDIEGSGSGASFEQDLIASTTPVPNLTTSTIANLIHDANKGSEELSGVYFENNSNPVTLEENIVRSGTFNENEIERSIDNVDDNCE